jgi:hypothetical protein
VIGDPDVSKYVMLMSIVSIPDLMQPYNAVMYFKYVIIEEARIIVLKNSFFLNSSIHPDIDATRVP